MSNRSSRSSRSSRSNQSRKSRRNRIESETRIGRAHVSVSVSAALGAPAREGSQVSMTGSVRAHGTAKEGGDGGVGWGLGSAGVQG